ncbi:MAG: FG-GAP-like repeat-containing protein, partial [Terriglobales bacterium]
VNGDGKLDLVVANECTNDNEPVPNCNSVVGVLLGNGDGTFQPAASYGTGGYYADSVAVEDVNGDGKLDIVVANQCADSSCTNANVGVLLGNGDGTFQTAVTYGSGGYYATSLAVADVNGDGKPDLLVANECAIGSNCGSSGKVGVLLGNGDGTFQAPVTYSSGGQFPYSLAVGDVNGDGKPDLVVTNLYENSGSTNGSLGVLLGNGDGTFRKGSTTMIPAYGLGAIVFSDFNGDGKLDVASGDGYGDGILLLGNGNGTFQSFMTLGAGGFGIAAGDFNLDGKPDLAVGGVAILLNITGEATTTTLFSSHNPSSLNQRTTFTATVSSPVGIPAGKVTFMNGTTALATKTLIGGAASFATSNLPAGMNSITAVYGGGGEANFGASTSAAVNQSVLTPTATTLSSSANPSGYGQKVTFTAVVTSGAGAPADGETVSFVEDLTILGSKKLSGGSASFTTSALPVGTHLITAVYGGDSSLARSASAWVKQVVKKAGE